MAASLLAKTGRPVAGSHRRSVGVVAVAQPERRRGIGLSMLSSVLATPAAQAASDFSIKIRDGAATGFPDLPSLPAAPQVQLPGDAAALFADNPLLVFGGAALLAVPLLYSAVSGGLPGAKGAKAISGARAIEALAEEAKAVFVDLRAPQAIKESGSPDLRSVRKKAITLPYAKVKPALGSRSGPYRDLTRSAVPPTPTSAGAAAGR